MCSQALTWDDVLRRDDLVGGDIESQEDGVVYRGPLSSIERKGDKIHFNSAWCARLNPRTNEWEKWHITTNFVDVGFATPSDIGEGRVFFMVPFLGPTTIFPKGGSQLDPAKVKGLEIAA